MMKSPNELFERIRKQIDENVKECDERIAKNDAIQEAHDNIVKDGGQERIPFYTDKNSETLNPKWIDEAVDIAANLSLEGFDNAIYEDAFKNGMRHVLDLLEQAANEPVTLDGCCDNCGKSKPEDDGKILCAECEKAVSA